MSTMQAHTNAFRKFDKIKRFLNQVIDTDTCHFKPFGKAYTAQLQVKITMPLNVRNVREFHFRMSEKFDSCFCVRNVASGDFVMPKES